MKRNFKKIFGLLLVCLISLVVFACGDETTPEPETFTVTFVGGPGATINPATRTVVAGQTTTAPTTATRPGHTLAGWYLDNAFAQTKNFATSVVNADMNVYARWTADAPAAITWTVTFDSAGGSAVASIPNVANNATIAEPAAPTKTDYIFEGWFRGNVEWDFALNAVTENITLTARWSSLLAIATPIRDAQDFFEVVTGYIPTDGEVFALMNDIDFADFDWVMPTANLTQNAFAGTLDGRGFTVSNIDARSNSANPAGIIPVICNATVRNLTVIDTIVVGGANPAGIIAGRVMRNATANFSNITIIDSFVTSNQTGAGAIVGHLQGDLQGTAVGNFNNIVVLGTQITATNQAAGGIIGQLSSSTANITNVLVDAYITATNASAGGVIGESVRTSNLENPTPYFTIENAVLRVNVSAADSLGAVVGRHQQRMALADQSGIIRNVIAVAHVQNTGANAHVGHIGRGFFHIVENVFMVAFNNNNAHAANVDNRTAQSVFVADANVFANTDALTAAQFAGFTGSQWDTTGTLPTLNGRAVNLGYRVTLQVGNATQYQYVQSGETFRPIIMPVGFIGWLLDGSPFDLNTEITGPTTLTADFLPTSTVTFDQDFYGAPAVTTREVITGQAIGALPAPTRTGFRLVGWFDGVTQVTAATNVTADMTLVAVWVQQFTVTFDSAGGSAVAPQTVDINQNADSPDNPTRTGYTFEGWLLDGNPFDINSTPITANITLVANWEVDAAVQFVTITFNDDANEYISSGEAATGSPIPGAILPASPRAGYRIDSWLHNGVAWDMNANVTGAMTLVAVFVENLGPVIPPHHVDSVAITSPEQFVQMANNELSGTLFHLVSNINFAGFTDWTGPRAFTGTLDGQGFALNNITINGNGIFGTIGHLNLKHIIINNAVINNGAVGAAAATNSGIIAPNTINNVNLVFTNITINNSTLTSVTNVANDRNSGALVGRLNIATLDVNNVVLYDVTVNSNANGVGLLFGRFDNAPGIVNISNIHADRSSLVGNDRVGGIVGAVHNPMTININSVVFNRTSITAPANVATIIGHFESGARTNTFVISNVLNINGTLQATGGNRVGTVTYNGTAQGGINHVFVANMTMNDARGTDNGTIQLQPSNILTDVTLTEAWFATYITAFTTNPAWTWNATLNIYVLAR